MARAISEMLSSMTDLLQEAREILRGDGGDRSDRDTLRALWLLLLPDECDNDGIGLDVVTNVVELKPRQSLTTDRTDPRLGHGVDDAPIPQHEVYLVLDEEERKKGFVRPYCESYVHATELGGCGVETRMGTALSETYARNPNFYGATYCVGCQMHKPVGENGEFYWTKKRDGEPWKVGT
jgi:hypothetical protein